MKIRYRLIRWLANHATIGDIALFFDELGIEVTPRLKPRDPSVPALAWAAPQIPLWVRALAQIEGWGQ